MIFTDLSEIWIRQTWVTKLVEYKEVNELIRVIRGLDLQKKGNK